MVVQPKLVLGPVNDSLEREADRVADQVIAMPAQSSVAGTGLRIQPFSSSVPEALGASASASVDRTLARAGTALSPALQRNMGRRIGFDFSRVRIYADGEAARSAEEMNALAYTAGHRVVFAPGQFAPTTTHGLRLLSHELTHVVQQSGGSRGAGVREQLQYAVQRQKAPDIDLARKLGAKLKAGKRDDVLADIEALHAGDLNGLELAVTEAFALDEATADDLRRVIRFVRHKPQIGHPVPFTASGGTAEKTGPKADPLGEFTPVKDLEPKGSLTNAEFTDSKTTDVDRLRDTMKVAHAQWINETAGAPSDNVHTMSNEDDVQPGLNYFDKLGSAGETVYIDAKKKNCHQKLPLDPTGPLPSIAVILGPEALNKGKPPALETLRHEERHTKHFQLAIGWLLKWRDAGAGKSFKVWLSEQHTAKKISEVDFDLVQTGLLQDDPARGHWDKTDTEILAHIEGMMAGLTFLPPRPEFSLMKDLRYPAPIDQLHLLLRIPLSAAHDPVKELARQRLHDFCCQVLDATHRDSFVAWIRFLLNPASLKASPTEKNTQADVIKDFKGLESDLKQVLAWVQKPCR